MSSAIEIRALSKRYGRVEAVRDVSIRVAEGETYGYLGSRSKLMNRSFICGLATSSLPAKKRRRPTQPR